MCHRIRQARIKIPCLKFKSGRRILSEKQRKAVKQRVVLFDRIQPGTPTKAVVIITLENLKAIESTRNHTLNRLKGYFIY